MSLAMNSGLVGKPEEFESELTLIEQHPGTVDRAQPERRLVEIGHVVDDDEFGCALELVNEAADVARDPSDGSAAHGSPR